MRQTVRYVVLDSVKMIGTAVQLLDTFCLAVEIWDDEADKDGCSQCYLYPLLVREVESIERI